MASTDANAPPDWARWWNRTRYRLYAPVYDWLARPMERGRRRAIEHLAPASSERLLLVGCGTGADLPYLPAEAQIIALDAVPAMVRRTQQRAQALGRDIDTRVGEAGALPFEDNAFDVVLLHLFLSVVPDPEAAASEAARVLTPNGRVSIYDKFVPSGEPPPLWRRAVNPVTRILFSEFTRRLEPILSGTGLRVTAHREVGLGGLYSSTLARPTAEKDRRATDSGQAPCATARPRTRTSDREETAAGTEHS
ncbi:MAG: class I SAM-dependent methyltransferase [Salinibacter sp.]